MTFIPKRLTRPVRRAALVIAAWTYRHTLSMWARSLVHELRRPEPFDAGRVRSLVTALVQVSADPLTANTPEIRRLRVDGDEVQVDVADEWSGAHLLPAVSGRQLVVAASSPPEPLAAASSGV